MCFQNACALPLARALFQSLACLDFRSYSLTPRLFSRFLLRIMNSLYAVSLQLTLSVSPLSLSLSFHPLALQLMEQFLAERVRIAPAPGRDVRRQQLLYTAAFWAKQEAVQALLKEGAGACQHDVLKSGAPTTLKQLMHLRFAVHLSISPLQNATW